MRKQVVCSPFVIFCKIKPFYNNWQIIRYGKSRSGLGINMPDHMSESLEQQLANHLLRYTVRQWGFLVQGRKRIPLVTFYFLNHENEIVLRIRIRGHFDPWIQDTGWAKNKDPDLGLTCRIICLRA